MSQYIANPHLIKGYKYDIRFYVLVTGVDPLKVGCILPGLSSDASDILLQGRACEILLAEVRAE